MTRKARLAALLIVALFAGLACQTALGYWSGTGTAGNGSGAAGAATLNQGAAPTAKETGSTTVVVSWGGSGLSNGIPADGYIVKRYDNTTGAQETIGTGCAGTIAASTCTESGTPEGDWEYTVTPVFGTNWRGVESVRSGAVNTGPGSITLSRSLFGGTVAPLPAVDTGTVSGFGPGQAISFSLDGSPLAGSPANVGADGAAAISVAIPAGTVDGPHTLSVQSASTEASAGILVDNTPPTFQIALNPPANAAGWNRTAPVEVGGTVDDGNGSGVAYAKYTTDGSDPKTSPTAQYETLGPISISATTTVKFFLADNAGNESPVVTQEVKIDTIPPYFTIEFEEITGGFYPGPESAEPTESGDVYYRGGDAGSVRFLMVPVPLGGSAAISAGFSELPADAVGFTFDTSTVTTPLGGPFLSNPFSWAAGTTSLVVGTVSLTNEAGSTFGTTGTFHNDSIAPAGGSVDAEGLTGTGGHYSTSLELRLNLAKGTDSGSGLADGTGPSDLPDRLERASAPLSTSNGIIEGSCGTYSSFSKVGADNPAASVTDTVPTNDSCYVYRYVVSDHVGNLATYTSPAIKVQTTAATSLTPTAAVLTAVSGTASQSISGSTVFYNPARSGSFNVDTSVSSPYSGVAQVAFPTITGFSGGGAVTAPLGGTTWRATYSWSGNGAGPSPGAEPISATNNAGQTATNPSAFAVVKDGIGPSGGSIDATGLVGSGGRYSTSTTLSLNFTPGTDAGSGLAASGAQLLRASAPLTSEGAANGTCGTFGAYTQVGANDPTTPKSDGVPADRTCYRYQYVVPDRVGNQTTYVSPEIKVDAAGPTPPVLAFSALSNVYWSGTGTALFYRPGAGSGGFQVTASSTDPSAGISGYAFPAFPAGWSSSAGSAGVRNYGWSAPNPSAPTGAQTVTATNNAGTAASSSFTATPDSSPPAGGTITYTNGYSTTTPLTVSFGAGTDTGSGLLSTSGIVEQSTATLAAGACGTFGAFTIAATNPGSPISVPTVSGSCYKFRYLISDNVGNQATYTGANVDKVDMVAPTNTLGLASAVNASLAGTNLYYRGNVSGSFSLLDTVADSASGPASATFPAISTTGWTHNVETVTTPAGGPYGSTAFSWTALPTNPSAKSISGKDAAGNSAATTLTFVADTTAPSGGSISYTNGLLTTASVPITTVNGSDGGSGVNAATATIKRDVAPLSVSTQTCGSFPGTFGTTVTLVGGADTTVTSGNCYRYEYLVSDNVGNQAIYTSPSVARVDTTSYANTVLATSGLVNYYRLGDSTISSDTFTGTAGTALQSHVGETGATWAHFGTNNTDAVLSDANRLRRNGVGSALYSASGAPPSADYSVQADVFVSSVLTQDAVGVLGRIGSGDNYYMARWTVNGVGTGAWEIVKNVNGAITTLATIPATLTTGQTYTLRLNMVGGALSLLVNGSQLLSTTDFSFAAAGSAGLRLGYPNATPAPTNTTGLQVDNFKVTPPALDSKGTANGTYLNGSTLGQAGALTTDPNTAALFDGVGGYVTAARQISGSFALEFWFKSTQGSGTAAQWYGNAGLVDASGGPLTPGFGVSLRSDGKVSAGVGAPDTTVTSSSGGYNNGGWHYVVFDRTSATGAISLYVDGVLAGSATGTILPLVISPSVNLGRIATGANYFAGTLDEVALYSSPLSAATISDHYARR
jgi:hypothetical protein